MKKQFLVLLCLVVVIACNNDGNDDNNEDTDSVTDADVGRDSDSDSNTESKDSVFSIGSVVKVHCDKLNECWPSFYDSYGGDDGCEDGEEGFKETFWSNCKDFNSTVGNNCITSTQEMSCNTYVNLQLNDPELPSACEYICGTEEIAGGGELEVQDIIAAHCEREVDCRGSAPGCADELNDGFFGNCTMFNPAIADYCLEAIQSDSCSYFLNHQIDDEDSMKECWYICGYDTMPSDV